MLSWRGFFAWSVYADTLFHEDVVALPRADVDLVKLSETMTREQIQSSVPAVDAIS